MTPQKNIVLIILDGCRAQSLGCYGYAARDTSPSVNRLAERGLVVERAYATSNCTFPSLTSMMTGFYPAQHGSAGTWTYYDGRYPFLTDLLRRHGYQTFCALNANVAMSPEWGFIRGYDRAYRAGRESNWFRDSAEQRRGVKREGGLPRLKKDLFNLARRYFPDEAEQARMDAQTKWYREHDRGSAKAVESFGRMLAERDRGRPFYMYVNLPDTHSPYLVPEPAASTWGALPVTRPLLDLNLTPAEYYASGYDLDDAERATLVAMYDTCVRYVDHQVGRMVEMIASAGLADDTVIVIAGDHGGMTYEHKQFIGAASFSYEPEIRVPLIVSGAGPVGRIGGLRSVVDLFPTLLDLAGVAPPAAAGSSPGVSLLADAGGHDAVIVDVPAWPLWLRRRVPDAEHQIRYGRCFRTLIKSDGTKLIWVHDGAHEVYDLNADPGELVDLYQPMKHLALVRELADRYERLIGPVGRHLETYLHTDVGDGLAALPSIDVVNPGFHPDSVVFV